MHYSMYADAVDRKRPTLIPKRHGVDKSQIGQRWTFTTEDVSKINKFYYCNHQMSNEEEDFHRELWKKTSSVSRPEFGNDKINATEVKRFLFRMES
jgi:hypothetical protein